MGICAASGVFVCDADQPDGPTTCDAQPAQAAIEICDGLDNDRDGARDEDAIWADLGAICLVGQGICEATGVRICDAEDREGPTVCTATPGEPDPAGEQCNGLDDGCDGQVDEDVPDALPCPNQNGVCAGSTELCGGQFGYLPCGPGSYGPDYEIIEFSCGDAKDNDCNGAVDDVDADRDGYIDADCTDYTGALPGGDCDDANLGVNPGMDEVCGNGFDEDCSGLLDDRDVDGDGVVSDAVLCGGTDCVDTDPMVYPGAPEVRDGKDNGCDESGLADEALIAPNDILVTEILYDSSDTPDENYEWFEVFNPTDRPIDMRGWVLRDDVLEAGSQETTTVDESLVVAPRSFAVLCRTGDWASNGGVDCDYQYGFMQLGNTQDELKLVVDYGADPSAGGTLIQEICYDENLGDVAAEKPCNGDREWPAAIGASLILDPDHFGGDTGDPADWCESPNCAASCGGSCPCDACACLPGNNDEASPGVGNVSCSAPLGMPQIVAVHPDNGLAGGGTVVRIVGSGFTGATDVSVGGVPCASFDVRGDNAILCTTDAGPAGAADVVVTNASGSDTLSGASTYTIVAANPAQRIDSGIETGPAGGRCVRGDWSPLFGATITESGVTGGACPAAGEHPGADLRVELGYGPDGSDPTATGSWTWFPAFCAGAAGDTFRSTVRATVPGTYRVCFRASVDSGASWTYVDLDGTASGFQAAQCGTLLVQ